MIQVKELFKRNKIKEYFSLSRQTTEQLCSPLSAEDQNELTVMLTKRQRRVAFQFYSQNVQG